MKRALPAVAALAVALLLPAAAAAKGPSTATIAGPGLDHALEIKGYGEGGDATPLGILVEGGGFFAQVFQPTPRLTTKARPAGQLGPRYDVTYTVPGPHGDSTLRQDLYPYATSGPLTYMAPGEKFWGSQSTNGGWFRGSVTAQADARASRAAGNSPGGTRSSQRADGHRARDRSRDRGCSRCARTAVPSPPLRVRLICMGGSGSTWARIFSTCTTRAPSASSARTCSTPSTARPCSTAGRRPASSA